MVTNFCRRLRSKFSGSLSPLSKNFFSNARNFSTVGPTFNFLFERHLSQTEKCLKRFGQPEFWETKEKNLGAPNFFLGRRLLHLAPRKVGISATRNFAEADYGNEFLGPESFEELPELPVKAGRKKPGSPKQADPRIEENFPVDEYYGSAGSAAENFDTEPRNKVAPGYIETPPKPPTAFTRPVLEILDSIPEVVKRDRMELGLVLREKLKKWDGEIDVFRLGSILVHIKDPNLALALHEWSCQQENYHPNIVVYTILVNILGKAKATRSLELLVSEVRTSGLKPTTQFFNRIMRGFADANDSQKAIEVYKELEKAGCSPDVHTMRTVIRLFRDVGDFDSAMEALEYMKKRGLPPSSRSYSMLIDLCGKVKKPEVAERLFESMKAEKLERSVVGYNCLIKTFIQCGEVDRALEAFWGMEEDGCKPDVVTYVSLLNGLRKAWRRDDALQVFHHLEESDVPASTELYTTVICLFGEIGDLETAEQIFKEMGSRGFPPDVYAYSSMMHIYGKAGLLDHALDLLDDMKREGLQPDSWVYSTLIEFLRHARRFDEADSMAKSLQKSNNGTEGEAMYMLRVQGLLDELKYREAKEAVEEMNEEGIKGSLRLYTHFLFEYTRCGHQEGLEYLVESLALADHPMHELVVLLQLPHIEGEELWEEVAKHLDSLKVAPFREGTHRFMDVLLAFLELRGYLAKAVRMWEEMKERRLLHPTITPPELSSNHKWVLNVVHFEPGAALIVARAELMRLRKMALESPIDFPDWMEIVTGLGSGNRPYGQVGPRERVLGWLNRLGSPFEVKMENQGRLEARGGQVREWLSMENVGWALEPLDQT